MFSNLRLTVKTFTNEVHKKSEIIFNSNFWNHQDLIVNALDNVEARQYVDSKCVDFQLPLFESGTLGSKCNTQSIIPNQTATYSEIQDVIEQTIPMCTIKSFPNKIEHCIEWALDIFHTYLSIPIQDINYYNKRPNLGIKASDLPS